MNRSQCRALLLSTFLSLSIGSTVSAAHQESREQRPAEHFCPITQEVMKDPVVASDGFSYERAAILEWIRAHHTSPMTRALMANDMHVNQALKAMINDWRPGALQRSSALADMTPEAIITLLQEEFYKNQALLTSQHTAKEKDVVVFLGNTGAGKSTLINFLAGKALSVVGSKYVLCNTADPEAMVIGSQLFNSETLYPKSIDISIPGKATLRFFDLPGLNDTDGSVRNLVNSAFVRRILLDAKTVRFVYVAGQDQFTADRGRSVTRTLQALNQLFVTAGNDRPLDGGIFVVTKEEGLLDDMLHWEETNMPEQIRIWRPLGRIVPLYHVRNAIRNTSQHREALLQKISELDAPQLLSVNVSSLYPPETRADIERMYRKMYEIAYHKAENDEMSSLSTVQKMLELWQRDTFWDEFEAMYVYTLYPSVDVLKDLTVRSYNSVRNKYIQEQEVARQRNIRRLQRIIQDKTDQIGRETEGRAGQIIQAIRADQEQYGGLPPYDFENHQIYWTRVCGAEVLNGITQDSAEQEVMRSAYARWIGEYYQRQVQQNPVIVAIQRQLEELSRQIQDQQRSRIHHQDPSSAMAAAHTGAVAQKIAIPDIAKGYEAVYLKFLRGKLVYRPDPKSDVGKIELPIAALANPLDGTFDLRDCGNSARHLSIATGYRKGKKIENAHKVEMWLAPRFLIERNLETTASHFRGVMYNWNPTVAPVGIFWTSGDWEDLSLFDYLTTHSFDQLSSNTLYEKCAHHGGRPCFTSMGPCGDYRHRSCSTHYERLQKNESSCFMFDYEE